MNKTTIARRKKIMDYVETQRHDPLFFYRTGYSDRVIPHEERYATADYWYKDDMSLADMVVAILITARHMGSANKDGVETFTGKRRSSLDIWRHIIAVRPDVELFDVMETILSIVRNLNINYCYVVHRTVFTYREYALTDDQLLYDKPGATVCREYGNIRFSSWNKLK